MMIVRRRTREAPMPYVPMADLAFNLVLFFIILAKAQQDEFQWERAQSPGTQEILSTKVVVAVDNNSKIYLNGFEVGVRDLGESVNRMLAESPAEKRIVLLKIHKNAPAAIFEPIMEAVSQAGAEVFHVLDEQR